MATTATRKKLSRKLAAGKDSSDSGKTLAAYEAVFDEIRRFTTLLKDAKQELDQAKDAAAVAKIAHDDAKAKVRSIEELVEACQFGLVSFLSPEDGEILPLFDRMDPPDEELHGENCDTWRREPIAALRISLPMQMAMHDAGIVLVGQLQDRFLGNCNHWWEQVPGLNHETGCKVADALNDFINERAQ